MICGPDYKGNRISSAVNLFLKQVINCRGIPFYLRLPNQEMQKAMDGISNSRNLEPADTVLPLLPPLDARR